MVALAVVVMFTILLVQGVRKIPVQYAKRIVGNKQYGGVRQYITLKVNAAGVMPIIFAKDIIFITATVGQLFHFSDESGLLNSFKDYNSVTYNMTFELLNIQFP